MPRRARFTIEGGIYHILSRGNNQQVIFHRDKDYQEFLDILSFYKKKYELEIYHYVLMSNHVHLIVKAPDGKGLSEAMRGIKLRYAQYYRKNHGGIGHLWQERFRNFLIQEGRYLLECGRYIELNPVKGGEERYFRGGAFGSREFVEEMKSKGLVSLWSHKGRPKKRKEK